MIKIKIIIYARPQILQNYEIGQVVNYIQSCHLCNYFPTFSEVQELVENQFQKDIKLDTLHNIVTNTLSEFFTTRLGKPMEISRLQIPVEVIEENINQLKEEVNGVPVEFIMNFDEMGQQEYADSKIKTVNVPQNYPSSFAPYPIDRKGQRYTVTACINSLDGLFLPLKETSETFKHTSIFL